MSPRLWAPSSVWVLASILILAGAFRFIGYDYDLPLLTHVDENAVIDPAVSMSARASLIPEAYQRPNHVSAFANLAVGMIVSYALYGDRLDKTFPDHRQTFYATGRLISAFWGVLLVLVIFGIVHEVDPRGALPAAAVASVFPPWVLHSHFITPDISLTFFLAATLFFGLRFLKGQNEWDRWFMLVSCGLAVLEKYVGALGFAMVLFAFIVGRRPGVSVLRESAIAAGLFALVIYVLSPSLILNLRDVLANLLRESRPNHQEGGLVPNLWFYFLEFLKGGGVVFAVLSLAGFFWALVEAKAKPHLWLLAFGLVFVLAISFLSLHWDRWLLPFFITPVIGFGLFLPRVWEWAKTRFWLSTLVVLVVALVGSNLVANSVGHLINLTRPNTIAVANSKLVAAGITLDQMIGNGYSPLAPDDHFGMKLFYDEFLSDPKKTYLVLSGGIFDRFFQRPETYAKEIALYQRARAENVLVFDVDPPHLPAVSLWEIENLLNLAGVFGAESRGAAYYRGPRLEVYSKPRIEAKEVNQ